MVFFNYALRKLNAKIVYYGPGLCGKTTNLQWIHDHFEGGQKGKMISLSTEGDRTIFFDLLPLDIGTIRGMQVTLQLYTVPGQVHYNSTRQLVLRGADGVVFVADSQRTMRTSNIESLHNLEENLKLQGVELSDFPHVLQFNKRDLRDLLSVDELDQELNLNTVPFFEAVATEGVGVQETLEGIVKLVMRSLRERYEPVVAPGQRAGATTVAPPAATVAPPPPAPPTPAPSVPAAPFAAPAGPGRSSVPPKPSPPAPPAFQLGPNQDLVSTGVYSEEQRRRVLGEHGNLTTASVGGPPAGFPPEEKSSPDILGPYSVEPMVDEPTEVRDGPSEGAAAVIIRAPDVDPWAPVQEHVDFDPSKPFTDQDTATNMTVPPSGDGDGVQAEPEFEFGVDSSAAQGQEVPDEAPPTVSVTEPAPPFQPPPAEPADRGFDEAGSSAAAAPPVGDGSGAAAEAKPTAPPAPPPAPATPPRRAARRGSVDDLVASILGGKRKRRPPAEPAEPPAEPVEPPAESAEGAAVTVEAPAAPVEPSVAAPVPPPRRSVTPVTVGSGDPFEVEEPPVFREEAAVATISDPIGAPGGIVRVGDNQLHLRLQGTGAIAESGQVRALDIEVPVPGSWVGNRRVTLQLRLTLSPAAEDDNGGSNGAP